MKTTITSFATRFIWLIPPFTILLITAIGNPNLFKEKQKKNKKIYLSSQVIIKDNLAKR
ncbi:hypothetical protein [Flectobacillus major]|uniref:hypothetical protein n=1 Tax=Flectobacillus major TaxID=103 RepID=UPI00040112EB|nr:hypothetical protein [Flectobacillus major]